MQDFKVRAPSYELTVVTPPAALPLSLAETKAHLRVLHSSEDTLIERLIKAATAHVEHVTGRALITRITRISFDGFPRHRAPIALLRPPVIAVTAFSYVDPAGDDITLTSDDYEIARSAVVVELSPKPGVNWPVTSKSRRSVSVTFTAGYGATAADVPEDLRNAILLLVEHFYYHRSAVTEGALNVTPMAVGSLLGPHMTTGWI